MSLGEDLNFEVRFSTDDTDASANEATVIAAGRSFVAWVQEHDLACRRFAAERLLDLYNSTWNTGRQITADAFIERMQLESASLHPDGGGGNLIYADGDLFWGHSIIVSFGSDRDFIDAEIAG